MLLSKNLRENILQTELCKQLGDRTLSAICDVFHANTEDITDITVLKKGMTNRSFIFRCNEKTYEFPELVQTNSLTGIRRKRYMKQSGI